MTDRVGPEDRLEGDGTLFVDKGPELRVKFKIDEGSGTVSMKVSSARRFKLAKLVNAVLLTDASHSAFLDGNVLHRPDGTIEATLASSLQRDVDWSPPEN